VGLANEDVHDDDTYTREPDLMTRLRFYLFATLLVTLLHSAQAQDRRGPFTHAPRSVRSRDVDQKHIRLELRFDWEKQQATGRETLKLVPFKTMNTVTLDAAEMQIKHVSRSDGQSQSNVTALKFETRPQKLIIHLGRDFKPGEPIALEIEYTVTRPKHGIHFVLPDESEKAQPKMVWTQCEPEYAHYWFPCIDTPSDRLTSEIIATVPADFVTLSNGELVDTWMNQNKTKTWHWSQKTSHVPYLFSIVAGKFDKFEQKWNDLPVTSYVPRGKLG